MHHLKAVDIPDELREVRLETYRRQLRRALVDPSLPEEKKIRMRILLENVGKPKPYAELAKLKQKTTLAKTAKTGQDAIAVQGVALTTLSKDDLIAFATERNIRISKSWKKTQILDTIASAMKA